MLLPKTKRGRYWLIVAIAALGMAAGEAAQEAWNSWLDNTTRMQLRANAWVLGPARRIYQSCENSLSNHLRSDMPDLNETIELLDQIGEVSASKVVDPPVFDALLEDEQVEWRRLSDRGGKGRAYLQFVQGRWSGAYSEWVDPSATVNTVTNISVAVRTWAAVLWLILLAAWLGLGDRDKARASEMMLAIAVFCVVGTLGGWQFWRFEGFWDGQHSPRLMLLALPLSAAVFYGCNRWRWAVDPRLCRSCHYDLIGNTSGVCPECGVPLGRDQREHVAKLWKQDFARDCADEAEPQNQL